MKPVGSLYELITSPTQALPAQSSKLCIYRRRLLGDGTHCPDLTGLLLPSGDAAQPTPACLVYRTDAVLESLIAQRMQTPADLSDLTEPGVQHEIWWVDNISQQTLFNNQLDQIAEFYPVTCWVAGAPASPAGSTLLLADNQLSPRPCHRLLADLADMDDSEFLQRLQKCFNIRVAASADAATPRNAREFGLYVAGYWYQLRLIDGTWFHADPVSDLDVSIVHDNMLAPLLGITDINSSRIAYSTAACSVSSLQQRVDDGQWQALWLMPAPSVALLMHMSDLGREMPANAVGFLPDPVAAAEYAGTIVSRAR